MSYTRDKDVMIRGVGAIAAIDAGNTRRARQRVLRKRVMERIDARRAQLAHGPGRKLPVPLGAVPSKLQQTITGAAVSSNSVVFDPRGIQSMTIGGGSRIPTAPVAPVNPILPTPDSGGSSMTTFPASQTPIPPKVPTSTITPSAAGARPALTVSGGGGGGGAGIVIGPTAPLDPIGPLPGEDEIGPASPSSSSSGMSTGTKVAIGIGVLGLLYLATRD